MSNTFSPNPSYQEVVHANLAVFDNLAASYDETEPHFRPENKARVRAILEKVKRDAGAPMQASRMLDVGCGTGFMISLARGLFEEIHGVDISAKMLERVPREGPGRLLLHEAETGSMKLPTAYFDVATAYSFLHHLQDIEPTVTRIYETLRPGGRFYADLEPNGAFLQAVCALDPAGSYDPIVQREIAQLTTKDAEIAAQLAVPTGVFKNAEFGKSLLGGFHESDLISLFRRVGFRDIRIEYSWYLGQGAMLNDPAIEPAQRHIMISAIDLCLRRTLPLTRSLFKYLAIHAIK